MEKQIYKLISYVNETLGLPVSPQPWEKSIELPLFLQERFGFYEAEILGGKFIFMVNKNEEEQLPAVIAKQMDLVRDRSGSEAVLVRQSISSYVRGRLIKQKTPFIVPGNQLFLPMLGVALSERLRRMRKKRFVFSPSTQALILHALWCKGIGTLTPSDVAQRLGYSAMTMTRAFDELEAAEIGEHSVSGKERHLCFPASGKSLWERILPQLSTPVKKHLYIGSPMPAPGGVSAGLSALAGYSMLTEPDIPVFACSAAEWKNVACRERIVEYPMPEAGGCEVEIWTYSPGLFAREGKADRLSLYLSLKDSSDERVQSALDSLLENFEW